MYQRVLTAIHANLIGSSLAATALLGIAGLGYATVSANHRASAMTAERDGAVAELQQLQASAGQLSQIETKIGSARVEYGRVVQAWSDAKDRLASTQQSLGQMAKRQEQALDRVNQTGSIKPSEPPKRPAR